MLLGSLSASMFPVPVDAPDNPEVVVPLVVAPELAAAAAAAAVDWSSTGAEGCVEQPAKTATIAAAIRNFFMEPPASRLQGRAGNGNARREIGMQHWNQGRGNGPHAGSRTSVAGATSRCFTRPSLE